MGWLGDTLRTLSDQLVVGEERLMCFHCVWLLRRCAYHLSSLPRYNRFDVFAARTLIGALPTKTGFHLWYLLYIDIYYYSIFLEKSQ